MNQIHHSAPKSKGIEFLELAGSLPLQAQPLVIKTLAVCQPTTMFLKNELQVLNKLPHSS